MSTDVAIPGDRNVIKKESEKILKYKDLTTEIQCMWNMKAKVMPVILGATETMAKSLRQYLSNILEKYEITEIPPSPPQKKTAILCTAHTNCGKC